jgi:hypothetical protein
MNLSFFAEQFVNFCEVSICIEILQGRRGGGGGDMYVVHLAFHNFVSVFCCKNFSLWNSSNISFIIKALLGHISVLRKAMGGGKVSARGYLGMESAGYLLARIISKRAKKHVATTMIDRRLGEIFLFLVKCQKQAFSFNKREAKVY